MASLIHSSGNSSRNWVLGRVPAQEKVELWESWMVQQKGALWVVWRVLEKGDLWVV
jgi:hypothetical protein